MIKRGFERESKEQKEADWRNKKLAVDSSKVSSNIRHGECGDVDLGCIPVRLVAYMRTCNACMPCMPCVNTHTCTKVRFPEADVHHTPSANRFNPPSSGWRLLL